MYPISWVFCDLPVSDSYVLYLIDVHPRVVAIQEDEKQYILVPNQFAEHNFVIRAKVCIYAKSATYHQLHFANKLFLPEIFH